MTHRVEDLAVDGDFNVIINNRGDVDHVSGREKFEQTIVLRITSRYYELAGGLDRDAIRDTVLLEAKRVAKEMDELRNVAAFNVSFSDSQPNKLNVEIVYNGGGNFRFGTTA